MGINYKVVANIPLIKTRNAILDSLAEQMNEKLKKLYAGLVLLVREIVYELISLAPEAAELRDGGTLAYQFGINVGRGNSAVHRIATRASNNSFIKIYKTVRRGTTIRGRIKIGIIRADYSDVLELKAGEQKIEGGSIQWLRWLLLEGDKVLVQNYGVKFKNSPRSRSGGAIMLKLTDKFVRPFQITPRELTGTEDDNWLTRAIERREGYLFGQINEYIKRNL
jgi:hypothetical protein